MAKNFAIQLEVSKHSFEQLTFRGVTGGEPFFHKGLREFKTRTANSACSPQSRLAAPVSPADDHVIGNVGSVDQSIRGLDG